MAPQLSDNDDATDLSAWLASCPSFAADWPRGVLTMGCAATDDRASMPCDPSVHEVPCAE